MIRLAPVAISMPEALVMLASAFAVPVTVVALALVVLKAPAEIVPLLPTSILPVFVSKMPTLLVSRALASALPVLVAAVAIGRCADIGCDGSGGAKDEFAGCIADIIDADHIASCCGCGCIG